LETEKTNLTGETRSKIGKDGRYYSGIGNLAVRKKDNIPVENTMKKTQCCFLLSRIPGVAGNTGEKKETQ